LLGYDPDKEFTAVASPRIEIDVPEAEQATLVALSNRLDYAQALDNIRDAIRGVRIARKNMLPEVNFVARHLWTGEGPGYNDATRLDDQSWFLGLAGNVDVYQREERNALSLAVIDRQTAEQRMSILDSALRRQVQQALLAYDRARQDVVIAEKNHALARDRARLARRLFELGRQDNFTVTDAETELSQAESAMLVSQADASVAAFRLMRTLGNLIESPEDLKPRPL
jgi:outer membrane protein TolC